MTMPEDNLDDNNRIRRHMTTLDDNSHDNLYDNSNLENNPRLRQMTRWQLQMATPDDNTEGNPDYNPIDNPDYNAHDSTIFQPKLTTLVNNTRRKPR
jgi:hypothetical protein